MFSLICAWINDWVNNHVAGDLIHHHAHYDVIVMLCRHGICTHKTFTKPLNFWCLSSLGFNLNIKTTFPGFGTPTLIIRQSRNNLIFIMGIPIKVRLHFILYWFEFLYFTVAMLLNNTYFFWFNHGIRFQTLLSHAWLCVYERNQPSNVWSLIGIIAAGHKAPNWFSGTK